MHIFIEGPDGVGKTTLIKKLLKDFDLSVVKMPHAAKGFREGSVEDLSYVFNKTLAQFSHVDFIVDRGFMTSLIYSKIYNREYDFDYINDINTILEPVIIYLTATEDVLLQRRRNDKVISNDMRKKVHKAYEWFYRENKKQKRFNIVRIDTTNLTPSEVYNKALKGLKKFA